MNYGSEPADQVVRYSLEGAEFALRISGTAAKNFFIFAQAVLHDPLISFYQWNFSLHKGTNISFVSPMLSWSMAFSSIGLSTSLSFT